MSRIPPIVYEWTDDGHMVPLPFFRKRCDEHFVVGEHYRLDPRASDDTQTRNHQFAVIRDAWLNLPEHLAAIYPSPEHLRKRALIEAGFYHEEIIDTGSKAGALRVTSYVRHKDDFALVIVRGPLVVIRTAKSQSRAAMDKAELQKSKTAILDIIAQLVGTDASTLAANTEAA